MLRAHGRLRTGRVYLAGLHELGYDMVMVWPLLDCMPAEPTASDRDFLALLGRVIDLIMNLELRAALIELKSVIAEKGKAAAGAVRNVLGCLRPYQQRLGFNDAYSGPMSDELNGPLQRLDDDSLNLVLKDFKDWRNPAIRNGIVPRLLDAMETYCRVSSLSGLGPSVC
jgi:hypothetical protein